MDKYLKNKKILIIDDDKNICRLISDKLSQIGAIPITAASGHEGLKKFYEQQPDLVILDLMMPALDGWQVCTQIRHLASTPIIMLTALGGEEKMIRGLECGAIDYVTKPFSPKVLLARIGAVLRHAEQVAATEQTTGYTNGYLAINLAERRVLVNGKVVKLSPTEFKLLAYLVKNANRVLTLNEILENVWGWEYRDSSDYVHVYVSHLRRKLEKNPKQPQYLQTEHGIGYYFQR